MESVPNELLETITDITRNLKPDDAKLYRLLSGFVPVLAVLLAARGTSYRLVQISDTLVVVQQIVNDLNEVVLVDTTKMNITHFAGPLHSKNQLPYIPNQ